MDIFKKVKRFVYQNARPLDFARWRYHFEGASEGEVLDILAMYQNPDGGFSFALEPDNWNPESTPIATWTATKVLQEINFQDSNHPVIAGILRYLDSGKDFADGKGFNTVPGNNDHPHAVWWSCENGIGTPNDNPTVTLCGFVLQYAAPNSSLWKKCASIAKSAVSAYMETSDTEMHTLNNYLGLLRYCERIRSFTLFELEAFREKLYRDVEQTVCKEPEKWYTEYVAKPSFFYDLTDRLFDIVPTELCRKDAEMMAARQSADGSWPVVWQWWNEYKEYEVSANWWCASLCVDNLMYLESCKNRV